MLELTEAILSDLGEIFDGPHATPTRIKSGPFFLNIASLKSGRLDLSESDHLSSSDFAKWTRRVTPEHGDLLFSYETRLGEAAIMPADVKACLGRRMALLRPRRDVVDPRFLLYYYLSPSMQEIIRANTIHGATVTRIGLATMGGWPVLIPALKVQREIAAALGALDDKIEANRQVIGRCEDVARATWETVAEETQPLSLLARFVNGRAFTKNASGTGRIVVRIAELNSGMGASTVRNDIEVGDDNTARPGDLLFAWSGSLTVARWYRPEAIINQHIFKVIPRDGYPMWLVDQAVRAKLQDYRAIAADKATTMGHIQRAHLDQPVAIPAEADIERLDGVMQSLWDRALAAEIETLQLEQTRDELLPLLMSGKVTVRDLPDNLTEVAN